ncbi:hypothetical protein H0H81_001493 [Sphagnurus paluster]|uniref:Uncharacterized protein n=1 Tax=Sphagnurus paluster TaxID=117069 RepID=A0A9P7K474_9AGAR|nr:hypothetical protein H0H81_001493 [Sphagnurus paluster]
MERLYLSGSAPFFGGRSSFWSIWSPRAIGVENGDDYDLMREFPDFMKNTATEFYDKTEKDVLHVQEANHIADPVFTAINLQGRVTHHLANIAQGVGGDVSATPAKLATGLPLFGPSSKGYRHFSAIASLLKLNDRQNQRAKMREGSPIMIATDTIVERFEVEPARPARAARDAQAAQPPQPAQSALPELPAQHAYARILHTSRGPLRLYGGKTNVILAAGAIPNTTILLNSIENEAFQAYAGQRLTAHFRSHVMGRFKADHAWFGAAPDHVEHPVISAHHVRGTYAPPGGGPSLQWHIQINGIYIPPDLQQHHVEEIQGMLPDIWSAPTSPQVEESGGHVVLTCSVLGELPEGAANALWAEMIARTFSTVRVIAANHDPDLQFWKYTNSEWDRPGGAPTREHHSRTIKPLFHEASTNYMAADVDLPDENPVGAVAPADRPTVDLSYRPLGLRQGNVYVTGAGLFPTAGSWNPTPTICALAQHLATTLVEEKHLGRAAFNVGGTHDTWFFNGIRYVRIEWAAHGVLPNPAADRIFYGPVEFNYEWRALWHTGFRQIDVILPVPSSPNEAYIFSGTKYARIGFHPNYDQLTGYRVPRLIADGWPSLNLAGPGFTTALCGNQYVRVHWDVQHDQDILVGQVAAIHTRWNHVPPGQKFNTIFPDPRNPNWAYLFSGARFWRINITTPANDQLEGDVAKYWPSLKKANFI